MPTPALTLLSPSKINLHLRVAAPDASGFHPLRSWMITTTLCDELTFSVGPAQNVGPARIVLTCDDPSIPCDATNLVARAATALLRESDIRRPVAIHLAKRIPAGAGLGGGSGDAATTLVGLNRVLALGRSRAELHAIAATLGSDVPFFLGTPSAVATGRGERLSPCSAPLIARYAVLILPPFAISTAAAYRTLDALRPIADAQTLASFDAESWAALPATELLAKFVNDLEPAAFALESRLEVLRREVEAAIGRVVRMSGSGSTLFTLFDDSLQATHLAALLTQKTKIRSIVVELGRPSGFSD